ncbi:hypothetical protein PVAP13_1KG100754 [Panicum virgatum]|uniref:Uncharacterized protein n=1 Tax=Panicum virgatum TaxID=38727 RepID=A0A8T0XD06_PANVG|nr:hypothetical protein PVAP13_1KG100754 [Panicum virgatum]
MLPPPMALTVIMPGSGTPAGMWTGPPGSAATTAPPLGPPAGSSGRISLKTEELVGISVGGLILTLASLCRRGLGGRERPGGGGVAGERGELVRPVGVQDVVHVRGADGDHGRVRGGERDRRGRVRDGVHGRAGRRAAGGGEAAQGGRRAGLQEVPRRGGHHQPHPPPPPRHARRLLRHREPPPPRLRVRAQQDSRAPPARSAAAARSSSDRARSIGFLHPWSSAG